jgi:hypothetical protein
LLVFSFEGGGTSLFNSFCDMRLPVILEGLKKPKRFTFRPTSHPGPEFDMQRTQVLGIGSLAMIVAIFSASIASGEMPDPKTLDFNRDIRPILSNRCFRCHGPDENERQGGGESGLRLDNPEGIVEDLGGHFAVVPGKPEQSELILRIKTQDPSTVMPPPETGLKLNDTEIALLERWVRENAPYAIHWSYRVPQRPALPELASDLDRNWTKSPLDHFVLERLRREGLAPQPEADRYALIRRVALDVTGLPPSQEEIKQYIDDTSSDAYEKMVDRFLAKESYGEHWARMWLDMARYADSSGYADDPARTIWAYRDYVIGAFNRNLPFDQFTIEQLAGDMLPSPSAEQLVATAFHRNTLTNNEGGTNDEEFRNVAVVDRVNTTYAVWMGTTMACAQCHSHKYDPISQQEYFQTFAIFNNTEDADRGDESPLYEFWTDEQLKHRAKLNEQIAADVKILDTMTPELEASLKALESSLPRKPAWSVPKVVSATSEAGVTMTIDPVTDIVSSASGAGKDNFHVDLDLANIKASGTSQIAAISLETLADDRLPNRGPGWNNGNFVLTELRATLLPPEGTNLSGRYVRIELSGSNKVLSLAEVEVFAKDENVARKGTATQSSVAFEGAAARAIDGNTNGNYFEANSVTHSAANDNDLWWEVDLGSAQAIDKIAVWNRTDGGAPISARLKGASLKVLSEDRKVLWEKTIDDTSKADVAWNIDGSRPITFAAAFADFQQDDFVAANLASKKIDPNKGWAVAGSYGRDNRVTLVASEPIAIPEGSRLRVSLIQQSQHVYHIIGRFRVSLTGEDAVLKWAMFPGDIQTILQIPEGERTEPQKAAVAAFYRSIAPELEDVRKRLKDTRAELTSQKPTTTVPILLELPKDRQRVTKLQYRGNYLDKGEEVRPGIPGVFKGGDQQVNNRLELAKWIVSKDNPLTARVMVNRYWEQLFGTGLVATAEEFGSQGDLPSHPELLDWLAIEFVENGWNMKQLLRSLLTSATYRQSSKVSSDLVQLDPDNRLLARGPRFRLPAETIRDQAIAVAGLLSTKMHGPPVKPPQPAMGLSAAFGSSTDWATSAGDDRYRRGLYTTWRRSNPYPSMSAFDAPNREVCTLRRVRTNTPLQALVTLNDPVYIEAAQALGRNMFKASDSNAGRIEFGLKAALCRPIQADEIEVLQKLHEKAFGIFKEQPDAAKKMATDPLGALPEGMDAVEMAAWTVVANAILNLDEFLMRR